MIAYVAAIRPPYRPRAIYGTPNVDKTAQQLSIDTTQIYTASYAAGESKSHGGRDKISRLAVRDVKPLVSYRSSAIAETPARRSASVEMLSF